MKKKKYYIYPKGNKASLYAFFINRFSLSKEEHARNMKEFNEKLSQYGLISVNNHNRFEVVNDELFSLFVLEFGEEMVIEECLGSHAMRYQ